MTLNYTKIFTTCEQTANHKCFYATTFSSMVKQKEKEVLGINNSINKSKYSKTLNDTMHFYLLFIYFVFTMKIK